MSAIIPEPPKTRFEKMKTLGPAITFAAASIGIGELVFAGTGGAFFPFILLPFCFFPILLKYYYLKEIGKFTTVTGEDFAKGLLTSSRRILWAFYLITIAFIIPASGGILAFQGQVFQFLLPLHGDPTIGAIIWGEIILGITCGLIVLGHYKGIENISKIVMIAMVLMSLALLVLALPPFGPAPQIKVGEFALGVLYSAALLGWVGSGASTMAMYSSWVKEKGYGLAGKKEDISMEKMMTQISSSESEKSKLRAWVDIARWDVIVSSIVQAIVTVVFFILGSQLLINKTGEITQGTISIIISDMYLTNMGLWAQYFFLIAAFLTFWSTGLTALDGYPRFLKSMTLILVKKSRSHEKKLFYLWIGILVIIAGTTLAIWGGAPLALTMAASVIDGIILTILLSYVIIKVNKQLPGEYKIDQRTRWVLIISAVLFAITLSMLIGVMLTTDFGLPPP